MIIRLYAGLLQALGLGAATIFGAVAAAVAIDVAIRNLGFGTIQGIVEISEYSMPLATLMAAPWLLYRNQHVRIEVLVASVSAASARRLGMAGDAVGFGVSIVLSWYGAAAVRDSVNLGSLVIKAVVFPEWCVLLPLPLAFALLAVEFARRLYRLATDPATP
jgi:TRAP-type C4-dicarboxylate transport system permease small subunit